MSATATYRHADYLVTIREVPSPSTLSTVYYTAEIAQCGGTFLGRPASCLTCKGLREEHSAIVVSTPCLTIDGALRVLGRTVRTKPQRDAAWEARVSNRRAEIASATFAELRADCANCGSLLTPGRWECPSCGSV